MSVLTRARAAGFSGVLAATLAFGIAFAPAAFAHHPEVVAAATCDGAVAFTSEAWASDDVDERTNGSIEISVSVDGAGFVALPQSPAYHYGPDNDFTFSDTYVPPSGWSTVVVRATALGAWNSGASAGDSRSSGTVTPLTDCEPTTPPAAASASIADATCVSHGALVQLSNPGDTPVEFTITGGSVDRIVTVAPASTQSLIVTLPAGGIATITVAADSMETVVREVSDACLALPVATHSGDCADGTVVVHLTNTGDAPADFTIAVPGQPDSVTTVAPGAIVDVEVAVPTEATTTVTVTSPGMADVTITCVAEPSGSNTDGRENDAVPEAEVLGVVDTAPAPSGQLPATGSTTSTIAWSSVAALVTGGALIVASRRRAASAMLGG